MERRAGTGTDIAANPPQEVSSEDFIWEKRHATLYRCALASRYHRSRERFFDLIDRVVVAASLIGGSTAFALAAQEHLVQWAGAAVAVASSLSLVFAFGEKARRHSALAERYKRVEAEIMRVGEFGYTEEQVNGWRAAISEIESNEPPTLRTLVSLCQNDIAIAHNQFDKVVNQPWRKRLFAHFFDIEPTRRPSGLGPANGA